MSTDRFVPALLRDAELSVAVAITSDSCRAAQAAHGLASSSCIALGRLLTATALSGLMQRRPGITSMQIICQGRLGHLLGEVNQVGDLRGFVRHTTLDLPQMNAGGPTRRRSVALGVGEGMVAVIREPQGLHFTRSTTELVSGEIDVDVEHHLLTSDQIPSALACDVVLDDTGTLIVAGGILAQTMPGGDLKRLHGLRDYIADGGFIDVLQTAQGDAERILATLVPGHELIADAVDLRWRCRCSHERVLGALSMLDRDELVEMIQNNEPAVVNCDFCATRYEIAPSQIAQLLKTAATAKG